MGVTVAPPLAAPVPPSVASGPGVHDRGDGSSYPRGPMHADLLAALWCPDDHGSLRDEGDAAGCTACGRRYPVVGGVLSFLDAAELSDVDRREQEDRDHEAAWYDSIWPAYVDKVELAAHADPLGRPAGPVLDLGSGPGRVAEFLARQRGLSVVA